MPRPFRLALACIVALACRAAAASPSPRPPVVVALVIDQLADWIADERWPTLPPTGGFARLTREGTRATLLYRHAVDDTAPGHAALFTGAVPRDSGIFANEVIDEKLRTKVSSLVDDKTRIVASDGPRDLPSSSLALLRVPTLADELRRQRPRATIVSLSLKDRAALFGGGRAPTAALWFDAGLGRFVTSTAVARDFPAWALPVVGPDFLRALMPRVWTPLDEKFVAAHALTPDAQPGEGALDGWTDHFPHALGAAVDPARAFRATPFADETLLALALAAVDARDPAQPMLLAVSLSANDYVGHVFGPDSWEAWDELERLDAALGRFFAALDEKLGADGWAIVLSGDHGVVTLPEAGERARPWCEKKAPDPWARPCGALGRILPDELAESLRAAARRALGDGDWIAGIADPYVYVTDAARALDRERRGKLDDAIADAARAWPGVAKVYDARRPPARCRDGDDVDTLVCRALVVGAPGEIYLLTKPGWFFDPDYVVGKGTSHGSPYRYDRAVPLVARAPGRVSPGRRLAATVTPAAFAATAARLLGIAPPQAAPVSRSIGAHDLTR